MKIILVLLAIIAVASASYRRCYSVGDPHYQTFFGRRFDNYYKGTLGLAKTSKFLVHTRTARWHHTSVNVETGVKVKGHRFIFNDKYNNAVTIDGKRRGLRNGRNTFYGVHVDKAGTTVVLRVGCSYVSVQTNYNAGWARHSRLNKWGRYQNVYVYDKGATHYGLCGNGRAVTASGIFGFVRRRKIVKTIAKDHFTHQQIAHAKRQCDFRFHGRKGQQYNWCVFDVARGIRAKWAANYAKMIKYWAAKMKKYQELRKHHKKQADAAYKRYLAHMKAHHIHGKHYRNHMNARNAHNNHARNHDNHRKNHEKARNAHNHHAWNHNKAAANYRKQQRNHEKAAKKYKKLADACQKAINHCHSVIRKQQQKQKGYLQKYRAHAHMARVSYSRYVAHRNAARAHHRHAINHNNAAKAHGKAAGSHRRAARAHHKQVVAHLRAANAHSNAAKAWLRRYHYHNNHKNHFNGKHNNAKRNHDYAKRRHAHQFKKQKQLRKTKVVWVKSRGGNPCYTQNVRVHHNTRHLRCRNGYALKGIHRNHVDDLRGINKIKCCRLPGNGRLHNHKSNWWSSFDKRGWSTCPHGYLVNGIMKTNGRLLYNIEEGYCQKRRAAVHCYTETSVVGALDRPGWAVCKKKGYMIGGFWRNVRNNHHLHRLEYFKCCRVGTNTTPRCAVPHYLRNIRFASAGAARRSALNACRHRNRFIYYSCVYDRSIGMRHARSEYNKLAHLHRGGYNRRCYSVGDPHMRTFAGRGFNVYHVNNQWRSLIHAKDIYVRTLLGYSRQWRHRSLNRAVYMKLGNRVYYANRNGHCRNHLRWQVNHHNYKRFEVTYKGYRVRIEWRRCADGGYFDLNIWTSQGQLQKNGCTGLCCHRRVNKVHVKTSLRRGDPTRVKFSNACARKKRAYQRCQRLANRLRGSHRQNWIRNCVNQRRNL